jgi:hypothetical protein
MAGIMRPLEMLLAGFKVIPQRPGVRSGGICWDFRAEDFSRKASYPVD